MTGAFRKFLIVAVLAFGVAPLSISAQAQTTKLGAEARLIALTDTIEQAVGVGDTVILIYVEFDDSANPLRFVTSDSVIGTRFAVPGTKLVRTPQDGLLPIAKPLGKALFKAVGNRSQRWLEMVIDHGKAAVRSGKLRDLPKASFGERIDAATRRVFPGHEVVPYKPDEAKASEADAADSARAVAAE